jgi:hypothetical protein
MSGSASAQDGGVVVEQVVAVVAGQPITMSELAFEARVALVQRGGTQAAVAPLDDSAMRSALDLSIGERLAAREADRLSAFQLEDEEVNKALARFREKLGAAVTLDGFLARYEMDIGQLATLLARSLRAERYLDGRVRLRAQVTEADVKRYYREHAAELKGDFLELRAMLREKLYRERYLELAKAEVAQMRKGADVRLIAAFVDGASPAEASP